MSLRDFLDDDDLHFPREVSSNKDACVCPLACGVSLCSFTTLLFARESMTLDSDGFSKRNRLIQNACFLVTLVD